MRQRARHLPPGPDPDVAALRLLGLEGRERARDDRRRRGGLLRRLHRGARASQILSAVALSQYETCVGGDPRRQLPRLAFDGVIALAERALRWHPSVERTSAECNRQARDSPRMREEAREESASGICAWPRSRVLAALAVAGCAVGGLVEPAADEGDAAEEVGAAGPVRRLLRRQGQGLLQGRQAST